MDEPMPDRVRLQRVIDEITRFAGRQFHSRPAAGGKDEELDTTLMRPKALSRSRVRSATLVGSALAFAGCPPHEPAGGPTRTTDSADATTVVIAKDHAPAAPPAPAPTGHPTSDPGILEVSPAIGPCVGQCAGATTPALIGAVKLRAPGTRACYEKMLQVDPKARGSVLVLLRVGAKGEACSVLVESTDLGSRTDFVECLKERYAAAYPKPRNGCVQFSIPLKFEPAPADAGAG